MAMQAQPSPSRGAHSIRACFGERLCSSHRVSPAEYSALMWRLCATWPTKCLRPIILVFAPRYFEAEDACLDALAQCRWRWEITNEVELLRVSYLRRGFWRYLGIGLQGQRLLRCHDDLIAREVTQSGSQPIPR
jgi:hypothetical protein